jgi:hypothetical protein
MNSKVLMVVALLFAGSVSAIDNTENIPSLTGKTWFGDTFNFKGEKVVPVESSFFDFIPRFQKSEVQPTRFARFKEVVSNNRIATAVAVVATVAVIAAVVAASSKNEVIVAEEENYFA